MIIIQVLQYCLACIAAFILGYQLLLSLLSLRARIVSKLVTQSNRKFAIILLAQNNEHVIPKTLYSLSGIVYPKNLYDIFVIADNCTDKTAHTAEKLGAVVLTRNNGKKGKQFTESWAFKQILDLDKDKGYDAVVVFVSETLVLGNFLEVMNYYLSRGSKVIQSNFQVLLSDNNWYVELVNASDMIQNYVKPLGRKVFGLDVELSGNGMCFSTDVLREFPLNPEIQKSDFEQGLILQMQGTRIDYAPEANIFIKESADHSEKPLTLKERHQFFRKYSFPFIVKAIKEKSFRFIDTLIELITPPLPKVLLFITVMILINIGFGILGFETTPFVVLWLFIGFLGILSLYAALAAADINHKLVKSIIYFPVYLFLEAKDIVMDTVARIGKVFDKMVTKKGMLKKR